MKAFGAETGKIIGGKKVILAKKGNCIMKICTVYLTLIRIAKNLLETRVIIKIESYPFYPINLD